VVVAVEPHLEEPQAQEVPAVAALLALLEAIIQARLAAQIPAAVLAVIHIKQRTPQDQMAAQAS
jgi:transposase